MGLKQQSETFENPVHNDRSQKPPGQLFNTAGITSLEVVAKKPDRLMPNNSIPTFKYQSAVEKRLNHLDQLILKINKDFGVKDIHDFRVEVKKLKALLRLLRSVLKDSSAYRFPRDIDKSYKALGHLRECQIQFEMICSTCQHRGFTLPSRYLEKIKQQTNLCEQKARIALKNISPIDKKKNRIMGNSPVTLPVNMESRFIRYKLLTVKEKFILASQDDVSLHEMRKRIKDVQYILSLTAEKTTAFSGGLAFKTVRNASRMLGEFHDFAVALDQLERELKVPPYSMQENETLQSISQIWRLHKEKLKVKAWSACKVLMHTKPK